MLVIVAGWAGEVAPNGFFHPAQWPPRTRVGCPTQYATEMPLTPFASSRRLSDSKIGPVDPLVCVGCHIVCRNLLVTIPLISEQER